MQVQVWKDLVEGVKKNLNEVVLPKIEELRTLLIEKGDAVKTAEENQKEAVSMHMDVLDGSFLLTWVKFYYNLFMNECHPLFHHMQQDPKVRSTEVKIPCEKD